jgi:hypothetical protein
MIDLPQARYDQRWRIDATDLVRATRLTSRVGSTVVINQDLCACSFWQIRTMLVVTLEDKPKRLIHIAHEAVFSILHGNHASDTHELETGKASAALSFISPGVRSIMDHVESARPGTSVVVAERGPSSVLACYLVDPQSTRVERGLQARA